MKMRISDLEEAFMFTSAGDEIDTGAYLERATGALRYVGEDLDEPDAGVDKFVGSDLFLRIPNKYDLNLGKALVFDFVAEQLPDATDQVREFFRHRGAYPRFKDLLDKRDLLDAWYDFERGRTLAALRNWAVGEGIEVVD